MVTILKNQLLKHLSRFTKNLSPEQINVSALKGQGTLSSLQLDEAVLTDLLELPPWMKLSSATCGRATFRVHWTKLKTMPIELNLDDVEILIETCSEPRTGDTPSTAAPAFPPSKYSFIHKVIDGISITVNTARIQFSTPVFVATVQLSKITVESRTPQWQKGDLRLTRLKDPETQQLLIFKEVSWQTARIEAKGIKEGVGLPPLRLLTNQAFCRITIKKRSSDCFVVGSRILLILEEALWVLTDKQLGAALAFADSLSTLVRKASAQATRDKAQRKLETLPEYLAQISQSTKSGNVSKTTKSTDPLAKLFARHDVIETSYHFYSPKIDLHLCDDPGPGRSSHPSLASGAALQVSLQKLQFDYYPYHLASSDRNSWLGYRESSAPHSQWLRQALTQFRGSLLTLLESSLQKLSVGDDFVNLGYIDLQKSMLSPSSQTNNSPSHAGSPAKKTVFEQFSKLMTTCVILRLENYTLYKVTTGEKKEIPKAFIASDRERFTLPDEVRALHVEFTHFYYPGHIQFPVPTPKLYIQVNPTSVLFDLASCLWCNSFILNLLGCVQAMQVANHSTDSDLAYVDINVEAIMPRIIVDSGGDFPAQKDRPRSLVAQVSRASITNCGGVAGGTGELAACLAFLSSSSLLSRPCCTDLMFKHAAGDEMFINSDQDVLRPRALWGQPKLVWCVRLEPVWADFCGARASPNKPTPLLDAVPFTLWVYKNMDDKKVNNNTSHSMNSIHSYAENHSTSKKHNISNNYDPKELLEEAVKVTEQPDMQLIAQCNHLVSVQLNHYQYLVVMRLAERLTELAAFLTLDAARVAGPKAKPTNMVVGCVIPQIEVTLVLPSVCPGKESSRDLDSVLPDSSSLVDLHQNTGSGTLCYNPHGNSLNILSQSSVERHSALTSSLASADPSLANQDKSPAIPESDFQDIMTSSTKDALPNISNINAGITSMKRGFTNLISSLDAALKPSEQGQSPSVSTPQDQYQWDTVSVASSDSERYIMVQLAHSEPADNAFKLWDGNTNLTEGAVELAAEVIERSSSPSERSLASSCRRRDLVSMCTFKLQHVEVLQVSQGFYSRVSLNIGDVSAEDCPSIPWDELQSKFSSRTRGWSECDLARHSSLSKETVPKINVKLNHFPHRVIPIPYGVEDSITLDCMMGSFSGNLDVVVKDVNLGLNMSTALGLSDFIEDEIIVSPLPLEVLLEGVSIDLNEDRPASSISSPGAVPLKVSLSGLKLVRGSDGVLHLRPASFNTSTNLIFDADSIESSTVKKLAQENEELRRRLNALERLALENDSLKRSKEEMDVLKSCLLTAQDEVATLLDEKTSLLATVKSLQEKSSGVEVRGNSIVTWARSGNR